MLKLLKKRLFLILSLLILACTLIAGGTFAWINLGKNEIDHKIDSGSFIQQYFHCGKGTQAEPFVITRPIHYYHFVELYQRTDGFAEGYTKTGGEPYYFQVGYDFKGDGNYLVYNYDDTGSVIYESGTTTETYSKSLNMQYYSGSLALLPAGTSKIPFIGTMDGKGLTINDLHITATETISESLIYKTSDIGIFGYIGGECDASGNYKGGYVHDLFFDNVTIDISGLEKAVEPSPTASELLQHTAHENDEVYIGYLVGHLPIMKFDETGTVVKTDIFENVYVNNCTVVGGEVLGNAVTEYGYIGHLDLLQTNPDIEPTKIESIIEHMSGSGSSPELETGWGGSLDMKNLFTKLEVRKEEASSSGRARYVTEEVVISEVTRDSYGKIVTEEIVSRTAVAQGYDPSTVESFLFRVYNSGVDNFEGSYFFYNSLYNGWVCLSRSTSDHTKNVTYYKYDKEAQKALAFSYNGKYLARETGGTTVVEKTTLDAAAACVWDGTYLHTNNVGETGSYYLNTDGINVYFTSATDGTVTPTSWYLQFDSGERNDHILYTSIGGVKYYLVYGDSVFGTGCGWTVIPEKFYKIKDSASYLNGNGSLSKGTVESSATKWMFTNGKVYTKVGGTTYYLNNNNFALALGTSATTTGWTYTSGKFHLSVNGTDCYLLDASKYYTGCTFMLYPYNYTVKTIGDGTNYIKLDGTTIGNTTTASQATRFFQVGTTDNPVFSTFINNTVYYLNGNTNSLYLSTSSETTFTYGAYEGKYCIVILSDGNFYNMLYTSSTWKMQYLPMQYSKVRLYNGERYLNWDGTSVKASTTDPAQATIWNWSRGNLTGEDNKGSFYYVSGGTTYYLNGSGGTIVTWHDLVISTSSDTNWFMDNSHRLKWNNGNRYASFIKWYSNKRWRCYVTTSTADVVYAVGFYDLPNNIVLGTPSTITDYYGTTTSTFTPYEAKTVEGEIVETFYMTISDTKLGACEIVHVVENSTNYSYLPIMTKTDKEVDAKLTSDYAASYTNTGYLISGANTEFGDISNSDVRIAGYSFSNISTSLNGAGSTFTEENDGDLEVITYALEGGERITYRIKDARQQHNYLNDNPSDTISSYPIKTVEELNLLGYQDLYGSYDSEGKFSYGDFARDNLAKTFLGDSRIYGLHFMDAEISEENTILATNIRILGKDYKQYELPESCIDFNVQAKGRVSFFAGTWYNGNDAFFSLHEVFRDSAKSITVIKEIREIYKHKTDINAQYVYKYDDGTYSGGVSAATVNANYTLIFDMGWIAPASGESGVSLISNALYYFEVPVNGGEYALGSVSGHDGAYLVYLDIGANASVASQQETVTNRPIAVYANHAIFTNIDYRTSGQTIELDSSNNHRSIFNFTYTLPENQSSDNFSIEIVYQGIYSGDPTSAATDITQRSDYSNISSWCQGVYQIRIKNLTGYTFDLNVLFSDNDDVLGNDFPYAYEILLCNSSGEYIAVQNTDSTATSYSGTLRRWSKSYSVTMNDVIEK